MYVESVWTFALMHIASRSWYRPRNWIFHLFPSLSATLFLCLSPIRLTGYTTVCSVLRFDSDRLGFTWLSQFRLFFVFCRFFFIILGWKGQGVYGITVTGLRLLYGNSLCLHLFALLLEKGTRLMCRQVCALSHSLSSFFFSSCLRLCSFCAGCRLLPRPVCLHPILSQNTCPHTKQNKTLLHVGDWRRFSMKTARWRMRKKLIKD